MSAQMEREEWMELTSSRHLRGDAVLKSLLGPTISRWREKNLIMGGDGPFNLADEFELPEGTYKIELIGREERLCSKARIGLLLVSAVPRIVRHSSPRHSSPQTFITSDIHHPLPIFRHSSPQTFITSDVHHLRHSSPQTFITSDFHHPLPKIRHSSPRTFITSDIHHLRRSSPQTFITPLLNSDIHHLRHSSPPT